MAFVERLMNATFTLGEGAFGNDGANTVKLTGNRMSAKIVKAGGPSMSTMQLAVYGMTLSVMNKLSTLGLRPQLIRRNTVLLEAGDGESGMATVFIGTITAAWVDLQNAPDVCFRVEAAAGLIEAVSDAPPSSYSGPTDAAVIMSSLATRMGLAFENSGVRVILSKPYYSGSPRMQAQACANDAGINWLIDNGRLAIWQKGLPRGGLVPLVSPGTGMVGYPAYTSMGISVQTEFNASITYGGAIEVQSSQTPACGRWVVYGLAYDLATLMPGGDWFTVAQAARPGLVVVR